MTTEEYTNLAMRTEADQEKILARLTALGPQAMRLDNAARGLAGDAGEVSSAVMKWIEYGKPMDWTNLLEEFGDCLWRIAQGLEAALVITGDARFTFAGAMAANVAKLAARYGERYSDYRAANRDKGAERAALTGPARVTETGVDPGPAVGICAVCGQHHDVAAACLIGFTPDLGEG